MQAIADLVGDEGFAAHRGAVHVRDSTFLVFGNDGYTKDERARREVEVIRAETADRAEELGFATTEDGYSWALLIRYRVDFDTDAAREACCGLLTATLWRTWMGLEDPVPEADPFENWQWDVAEAAIDVIRPKIIALLNR